MRRSVPRSRAGLALALSVLLVWLSPQFRGLAAMPASLHLSQARGAPLSVPVPFRLHVRPSHEGVLSLNGQVLGRAGAVVRGPAVTLEPLAPGRVELEFRLLGVLPIHRVAVDVLPPVKVVPGGHSIGILLRSEGLLVVGFEAVSGGGLVGLGASCPARQAGLERGDVILEADGQRLEGEEQLTQAAQAAGRANRPLLLLVKRGSSRFQVWVRPQYCPQTGRHRLGVYVRDGAAGVGTLSFFEPSTGRYAALGHVIADEQTGRPLDLKEGRIVNAVVSAVHHARRGIPGEKVGVFLEGAPALGTIERNTAFGIVGRLKEELRNPLFSQPVTVAGLSEVRPGPAVLLTVVEGQRVEAFSARILKVLAQPWADSHGMVVKITDPRLLLRTGGIVQGMSGSPLIQDGRLVGALTHVFVNDPTRGYAVFGEWMAEACGLCGAGTEGELSLMPGHVAFAS
ncbi:MAG: SpoIVB peptidase [Acetobacteraceae bacterium]|nr:SpoIVB peptidase [Acetobacteraceae bacterium]